MRGSKNVFQSYALALGLILYAGCASVPEPAPGDLNEPASHLVDPRIGYPLPAPASSNERLGRAWSDFGAARLVDSERRLAELLRRDRGYRPAILGQAAVAIANEDFERATELIEAAVVDIEQWDAVEVYLGEIAFAQGETRDSLQHYEAIVGGDRLPEQVTDRIVEIRFALFDEILAEAGATSTLEAREILLREALTIRPENVPVRLGLIEALIQQGRFSEAREELEPLLDAGEDDLNQVQAALAEIELGVGRFEDAIRRLEALVDRTGDEYYEGRLASAKDLWLEANLPSRFQKAARSSAITRADLAVLIYWKVDAVRFANDVGPPPIAIDIQSVPEREELVRALAMGILRVDTSTREASPHREVGARAFLRALGTLLVGTDCASGTSDPSRRLERCGIDTSRFAGDPDASISGRDAIAVLRSISELLR